ncbi:MAG: hypothetical protein FWB91_03250 [Defluviitaleaceae bacterium]|nr:hypothetical protein [Defluviitaleaceae bacterium]
MLYKKRAQETITPELFKNPTSEYRGTPFWSWNCKLEENELLRQIDIFKEMGLGGFHIHSRSGLATPYMGEEFMRLAGACSRHAIKNEMLCWLYDEDRWPSGSAGGVITKDYANRTQYLVMCPYGFDMAPKNAFLDSSARYIASGRRTHLARYKVHLENGFLTKYERLPTDTVPQDTCGIWDVFLEVMGNNPWYNNQAYVNTLDKKAIDLFIEVTHEKYKKHLGHEFGKSIPAIFTDEPQFSHKETLPRSDAEIVLTMPFTTDFDETYKAAYGTSILDALPEVIWESGRPSLARYQYHDHVCERFTEAFADNVGAWCEKNNIMLTGHMMHEPTLASQTLALGETMRAYRSFQLPGIDMLCDLREYSTAKQAQSAARQYGREGVLSELYGVTNWNFDFRGHKLQGDWQAALGVTVRVHHLTWVSMAGEAKRDYPASIGYQSPWYKEYAYVEDHFARVNTALVRGKAISRVAVIHPVEGFWMNFGPNDKTAGIRAEMEADFENIINWLLFGHIDFDFVSESLLPSLHSCGEQENNPRFIIGEMAYDAVLVPNCRSLRSTTITALEGFGISGGTVIFAGEMPSIVDGEAAKPEISGEFIKSIPFSKTAVLSALEDFRDISMQRGDGNRAEHLIYQLRQDGDDRWLFVCNGTKPANEDIPKAKEITIFIKGKFAPTLYDTLDGTIRPLCAEHQQGMTVIKREMHMHDSLLIKLSPVASGASAFCSNEATASASEVRTNDAAAPQTKLLIPYSFELAEPNVLVLDMAEYAFDDEPWQKTDELLRIDNLFRKKLDYPLRMSAWAQPWTTQETEKPEHTLKLRFTIPSQIELDEICLALESLDRTKIIFNGTAVETTPEGYYVDRSIQKIQLPGLKKGINELVLEIAFDKTANVENCFLLGKFGVAISGHKTEIIPFPEHLPFGDISKTALPFYGGNVTYKCKISGTGGKTQLDATYFRSPLLTVKLNSKPAGVIAYAPYSLDLGSLPKGEHDLEITAFGSRINTFGTFHSCDETMDWFGPDAWRATDAAWSYEYQLRPAGILKSPVITTTKTMQ